MWKYVTHIYQILFYRLFLFRLSYAILRQLVRVLFFFWGVKEHNIRQEICFPHPSQAGLYLPSVEIRQHTIWIAFLDRMGIVNYKMNMPARTPVLNKCEPVRGGGPHFFSWQVILLSCILVSLQVSRLGDGWHFSYTGIAPCGIRLGICKMVWLAKSV